MILIIPLKISTKCIFKKFATLYFAFYIDENESELGTIDLIQIFVETIDKCYNNISETEFLERFDQVYFIRYKKIYYILNEMIIGGVVHEN
ncbi:hypothetical protein MXB_4434 [Myxobolus squamalis]|nr:hypothetical protein MXB_4434 [Myxobolus squamalis]